MFILGFQYVAHTLTLTLIRQEYEYENTIISKYILYNYELYKLIIKIYVHKYVLYYFLEHKNVFHDWFKIIYFLFYNYNKKLYNKFKFLEN